MEMLWPSEVLVIVEKIADDLRLQSPKVRLESLAELKSQNELLWALVRTRLYP